DNDAEVDGAKAHEIGANLVLHHAGEGKEHRKRDHEGSNECSTNIAEKEKEDDDDKNRAFQQILLDGGNSRFDQIRPVVKSTNDNAIGKRLANFLEFGGNLLSDIPTVLTNQEHGGAKDRLFTVQGDRTGAELPSLPNLRDIGDAHGNAVMRANHDLLDI